jgi:hypothetical protein
LLLSSEASPGQIPVSVLIISLSARPQASLAQAQGRERRMGAPQQCVLIKPQ